MIEKKIVVPDGMLEAASGHGWYHDDCQCILVSALRWLSENPIVPNADEVASMPAYDLNGPAWQRAQKYIEQWQRRMFLAPREPEVPEAIKDLLITALRDDGKKFREEITSRNAAVLEAYRRGREANRK